jgi:hypothetical protein
MFSIPDDAMFSLFDARYLKRDDPVSVFYDDKNESGWYTAKVESVVATGVKVKYTKDNSRELVRWDTPGTTATTRIRLPPSTSAMDQDESKRDNGDGGGGGRRGKCKDAVDASINSLLGELRTFQEENMCDSLAKMYVSRLLRRNLRDIKFDDRTLDSIHTFLQTKDLLSNPHRYDTNVDKGLTEGHIDGTDNNAPITDNNKAQYIARKVRGIMMDNVKSSLDCMRDGFQLVPRSGPNRGTPLLDLTVPLAVSACMSACMTTTP